MKEDQSFIDYSYIKIRKLLCGAHTNDIFLVSRATFVKSLSFFPNLLSKYIKCKVVANEVTELQKWKDNAKNLNMLLSKANG